MTQSREGLLSALSRVPGNDLFARMLLIGKLRALDRIKEQSHERE